MRFLLALLALLSVWMLTLSGASMAGTSSSERAEQILRTRSILALTQDCMQIGLGPDSAERRSFEPACRAELLRRSLPRGDARVWTVDTDRTDPRCNQPGEYDALNDGTCNPAGTGYLPESALAMQALLSFVEAPTDPLLPMLRASFLFWTERAVTKVSECGECLFVPYSEHSNDTGRHALAINARMAAVGAMLHARAPDERVRDVRDVLIRTHRYEMQIGNVGYLSVGDKAFSEREKLRTENHITAVILSYVLVAQAMKDRAPLELAMHAYEAWAGCNWGPCRTANRCKFWSGDPGVCKGGAALSHCMVAPLSKAAAEKCQLARAPRPNLTAFEKLVFRIGEIAGSI